MRPLRILSMLALAAATTGAGAQSLDALRAAREKAKADLVKAQEAFYRADDAYIKGLSAAAGTQAPVVAPQPVTPAKPPDPNARSISFRFTGLTRRIYTLYLTADGKQGSAIQLTGNPVPVVKVTAARSLSYVLEYFQMPSGMDGSKKGTLCKGDLPLRASITITVSISGCSVS